MTASWPFSLGVQASQALTVGYLALAALVLCALASRFRPGRRPSAPAGQTKPGPRPPGTWTPSPYRFPRPPPYPDWSLTTTKPLPYRPFRYGPEYHVTMGLRTCPAESWIELDAEFPRYHALKAARLAARGRRCVRTAPEALPAARELLAELAAYLPARYPSLYARTADGGRLRNLWSGEEFATDGSDADADPMATCARLVQDDLAIMVERADGRYYLLAGAVLLAGFWRLEDKFGMDLATIHTSGEVPQFRERLERGMTSLFRRLRPEQMVARSNYFVQVDDALPWSWSIGSEDGPAGALGWRTAEQDRAIEHHYFRSERQTLRRLPQTGAVVFTIRTYFVPVTKLAEEDYVPGRLASAVRSWGEDVSRYKGRDRYGRVLLDFLDRKHREQVERGLDWSKEAEAHTYPW